MTRDDAGVARRHTIGEAVFRRVALLVLPAVFRKRYLDEILIAIRSRRDRHLARSGSRGRVGFWIRETAGLLTTAAREWREQFGRRSRPFQSQHNRNGAVMSSFVNDLRFALRSIMKSPAVSIIAVLSLAVGVAANVTVFGLVNSWLLRPLDYPESDELVILWSNDVRQAGVRDGMSAAELFDWRDRSASWESLAGLRFDEMNLVGVERPERFRVATVTPNFFQMIGVPAALGRVFDPSQSVAGGQPPAVLSDHLWRDRFDRSADVLGQAVRFNGVSYTVVAVMPEEFDFFLGDVAAWLSDDLLDERDAGRDERSFLVAGRLKDGISLEAAQEEATSISAELAATFPETNRNFTANLFSLKREFPGDTDRAMVGVLMLVVFLVLVGACVNIAGLLLARADGRQREMAIRLALGAGSGRLLRLMGIESVVLALAAGVLGGVLGYFGVGAVGSTIPPMLPSQMFPVFDGNVALFTLFASLAGALTFGLPPARHAILGARTYRVTDWSRGAVGSRSSKRLRSFFVITQFAVALAILVSAGVLTEMMQRRLSIEPGFDTANLLTAEMTLPEFSYPDDESLVGFYGALSHELDGAIGPTHTFASAIPRTFNLSSTGFRPVGSELEEDEWPETGWLSVSPGYFETMGIPVLQGRTIEPGDRAGASPVVVVNRRFADVHYSGEDVVGRRIEIMGEEREIVGVTPNIAQERLTGLLPYDPAVYFPLEQQPIRAVYVLARSETNATALATPIRNAVSNVDPDLPVANVITVEEHMAFQVSAPRAIGIVLSVVGLLALALATMGVYGVLAYHVSQQTGEIGIRMALGAKPRNVLGGVLRHGGTIAGLGLVCGAPMAYLVVRMLQGIVTNSNDGFNVDGGVPLGSMVVPVAVLVGAGLVACLIPARRATRIDPADALRSEG